MMIMVKTKVDEEMLDNDLEEQDEEMIDEED